MLIAKRIISLATVLVTVAFSVPAFAGLYTDGLSRCLVESTTAADKHALARWMFATAALHPEVRSIASISPEEREEINRGMASLLERLLTVACKTEAQKALQYEGPATMEASFQILGQVAGRELFSNPQVAAGLAATMSYVDKQKLRELAPSGK